MKTKMLFVLLALGIANPVIASSPFMVEHSATESSQHATSQTKPTQSKTLAESLMQIRNCSSDTHKVDENAQRQIQTTADSSSQSPMP